MDVKNRTIRRVAVIAAAPCDCLNAHDAKLRHFVGCELSAENYDNSPDRCRAEGIMRVENPIWALDYLYRRGVWA